MTSVRRALWASLTSAPLLCFAARASAQELTQRTEVRVGAVMERKLVKKVRLLVNPELRTDGVDPDRYLLEFGLRYKPLRYLSTRAAWRTDVRETSPGTSPGFRPRLTVQGHLPLDDFEAKLRVQYQYGFGPERNHNHRFRYRFALDYDVPRVKVDLGVSAEAFQQLNRERGWHKMRYAAELSWKFRGMKKLDQWLLAGYLFDYYLSERLNVHIPTLSYRVRF